MAQVTIYTTPSCVYCKVAKRFFGEKGITYTEKNVVFDETAREEMIKKSGQLGVPVIEVDGNIIIGFNPRELQKLLGVT